MLYSRVQIGATITTAAAAQPSATDADAAVVTLRNKSTVANAVPAIP